MSLVAASNQYDRGIREVDRIRLRAQQARAQRKFEIYSSAEKVNLCFKILKSLQSHLI